MVSVEFFTLTHRETESLNYLSILSFTRFYSSLDFFLISLTCDQWGQYQSSDSSSWQPLATVVSSTGMSWSGQVICFKTNPINCTLLARWDDGYTDPGLILTDLNPVEADVRWYGFRSWIECSYRDVKSDGWQWHKTRLRQPDRAERHWLAMSVAMLWMVTQEWRRGNFL